MKKNNLQDVFFFLILTILTIAFYKLLMPFLADLFIIIILFILFKRPMNFFRKKFKNNDNKVAFSILALIIVTIIIPMGIIGIMVSAEASKAFKLISTNWDEIKQSFTPEVIRAQLQSIPFLGDQLASIDISSFQSNFENIISRLTSIVINGLQNLFMNISYFILHFCIILFLMYYAIIDGKQLIKKIQFLIPLRDEDEKEFYLKLEQVTDALILNTFVIGLIEGTYGAILFAILGIPSPFFWGTVMAFCSIIPFVGANSVFLPAAIIEFIMGNYIKGTILLVLGVGVIFVNQHIVKNRLDGSRSGMHPALVFIGCFGGMLWMGIIGFLAGPVIVALFTVIWGQFGKRFEKSLIVFNNPNTENTEDNKASNT